ncbi:UDP-glucose 4-epimerase GalE [Flexithrix dorotheae]|uniref:UDP-glucose 4-epimerase GalE n=1 Tax=Flexithrix dorotheae TaxID=70993 RepID=UPI00037F1A8F|nr:UDP-glucose 4-epimerase GalE [Flexithrix dorotheae]
MEKNTILVTGGCGYIGSHTIIEILRNTEFKVISVDNCLNSSPDTMERIEKITGVKVKNYNVDLTDKKATLKIFEENQDILGVIHFAALKAVGESVQKPMWYYENNMNSLLSILNACQRNEVNNFIFSSSCSLYGNVAQLPVDENTPLSKTESPYAHTKKIGEEIIENIIHVNNINAIALRYFNPVGADKTGLIGENPINKPSNLVPVITQTAVGIIPKLTVFGDDYNTRDGSCIRDYIHVTDIADAHIKALQYLKDGKNTDKFEIFNLGTGDGVTVLEVIKAFEKVTGQKLNYELGPKRPGDVEAIYSNSGKAEKHLGWKTKIGLDEMMASAWKWQQTLEKEKS